MPIGISAGAFNVMDYGAHADPGNFQAWFVVHSNAFVDATADQNPW